MEKHQVLAKLIKDCESDALYHQKKLVEFKFRIEMYQEKLDALNNE